VHPSYAFIEQPQTTGVGERFFRALKEQAIYVRICNDADEIRQAEDDFMKTYNHSWRLERQGYMNPIEYRESCLTKKAA